MTRLRKKITALNASGKWPAFVRFEIAHRSCSTADFWERGLPNARPGRGRNKATRSPAPAAAAIPDWPANPGLYSSRAVEVLWPRFPATSPFSCAISSPANQPNSLMALSPLATVAARRRKAVFTHTQKEKFMPVLTCVLNNDC